MRWPGSKLFWKKGYFRSSFIEQSNCLLNNFVNGNTSFKKSCPFHYISQLPFCNRHAKPTMVQELFAPVSSAFT